MPPVVRSGQFDSLQAEWEEILPSCSTDTIFVTPWWQRTWWRHFGGDSDLRILALGDNGVRLGVAPLMLRDGVASFLGGSDLFDYHDFLVPKGNEAAFYEALLDYLEPVDWHTIDLSSLSEGSPTLTFLPSAAEEKGYTFSVSKEDVAPILTLPSTWDEYQSGLAGKDRHELRRKLRRLAKAGVIRQSICENQETLRECMKDFFRLHRASSPDKAEFMTPQREAFFVDVASQLGERGQLKLAFLELDGVRVASCISFDYLNSYLLYNSGYDPNYSDLSVGLLNKALAVKDAIHAGKRHFDFLRGAERYKYELGATDRDVYQLIIRR